MMNERTIGSISLTQKLSNGTALTAGLVYSSDPEFLMENDKELSARIGLIAKLTGGKPSK